MPVTLSINDKVKLQRIDLRTTSKIKTTLARAAEVVGVSISTFLIEAAYEKAKKLLKEEENLMLSNVERDRFLTLLERKPNPTGKLKKAMQKYLSQG